MKLLSTSFLILFSTAIFAAAQCPNETTAGQTGKILAAGQFTVEDDSSGQNEMFLTLEAAAPGSSWAKTGAEAAVLTVFIDDKYNQDVVLFAGAEKFAYRVALGGFSPKEYKIAVVFNGARSAKNVKRAKIYSMKVAPAASNDKTFVERIALANAPFIYARPETVDKFSDIPLITYYEIFPQGADGAKIRYTTVFSNEDGGTQTAALMARWGRATDIEWVYEIEIKAGKIVSEIYQGANHVPKSFVGSRILGAHPLLLNQTLNNNFADAGCSSLRFAPRAARADLREKSRESVMDENGWVYRIMAEELMREGRVNAAQLDANTIADPRDYLYAEVRNEPTNAAVNVAIDTPGGERFSSDAGNAALRVSRSGYVRIALRLPRKKVSAFPPSVMVGCYPVSKNDSSGGGACQNVRVVKLVRLDEKFRPLIKTIESAPQTIKTGEKAVFVVSGSGK